MFLFRQNPNLKALSPPHSAWTLHSHTSWKTFVCLAFPPFSARWNLGATVNTTLELLLPDEEGPLAATYLTRKPHMPFLPHLTCSTPEDLLLPSVYSHFLHSPLRCVYQLIPVTRSPTSQHKFPPPSSLASSTSLDFRVYHSSSTLANPLNLPQYFPTTWPNPVLDKPNSSSPPPTGKHHTPTASRVHFPSLHASSSPPPFSPRSRILAQPP